MTTEKSCNKRIVVAKCSNASSVMVTWDSACGQTGLKLATRLFCTSRQSAEFEEIITLKEIDIQLIQYYFFKNSEMIYSSR